MKKMYKYLFVLPLLFLTFAMHAKEGPLTSHLDSIVLGSGCFWGAETVSYTHLTLPTSDLV